MNVPDSEANSVRKAAGSGLIDLTAMPLGVRHLTVAIVVAFLSLTVPTLASAELTDQLCLADSGGSSCTANDVRVTSFWPVDGTQTCVLGEEYTVTLVAEVESKAGKDDIGFWFAEGAYSAFDGDFCTRDFLGPEDNLTSDTSACTTEGPFYDGDGDFCGDVPSNGSPCTGPDVEYRTCSEGGGTCLVTRTEVTITTICRDDDDDDIADISACTSWNTSSSNVCNGIGDTDPGTGSKCNCGSVTTNEIYTGCLSDAECSDGAYCNGTETCNRGTGECEAGTPINPDDGVSCTVDSCDEVNDTVVNTPNDANCDNGLFCDGAETCDAVSDCQSGTPPAIDDGVVCTDDSCDEVNDTVLNTPNDANCDNGLYCDGAETCDAVNDCQSGQAPSIDDGVACTDDSCDEENDQVVNAPNNGNCDDGLWCNGDETCDAVNGCQAGISEVIDDGVACTADSCDEVNDVIVNVTNDSLCADGNVCNGDEICHPTNGCQAGTNAPEFTPCGDQSTTLCTGPDYCDGEGSCFANNEECGAVTSSALCEFDREPTKGTCVGGDLEGSACWVGQTGDCEIAGGTCEQSKQFLLAFGPDAQNWIAYKAGATNPGQFYYNAFYDATTATTGLNIHMEIPYPFITQGATPMHVYDGELVGLTNEGCYDPLGELMNHKYLITENDWLQPDGYQSPAYLDCDPVPVAPLNGSASCIVSVFVPQWVIDLTVTDFLYVNLHLDYGFKGNFADINPYDMSPDRYDRGGYVSPWNSSDALENTDDNTGEVAIADCTVYNFAHYIEDNPVPVHEDAVENLNEFKKYAGVFGQAACDDGSAIGGGFVKLLNELGDDVSSGDVDNEGYFSIGYKHKGKAAPYQLMWCDLEDCTNDSHTTDSFMLQANGAVEVNLLADDSCDDLDGSVADSDWLTIQPYYASGKFAKN